MGIFAEDNVGFMNIDHLPRDITDIIQYISHIPNVIQVDFQKERGIICKEEMRDLRGSLVYFKVFILLLNDFP